MKIAKIVAWIGLLAMTGILFYGFSMGDFSSEGAILMSMPWGLVSLVDLYTGFFLFSGWIVFREKKVLPSTIWVILMMVLGFWAGALYTLIALNSSGGDWHRFWFGKRVTDKAG
jgi:hypothetical protein